MEKRPLIIDCDPGTDDAIAILIDKLHIACFERYLITISSDETQIGIRSLLSRCEHTIGCPTVEYACRMILCCKDGGSCEVCGEAAVLQALNLIVIVPDSESARQFPISVVNEACLCAQLKSLIG